MPLHEKIVDILLEAKQSKWLDFNQVVGTEEPSGVFAKDVNGVRIYSARCPGCKRIHGNFRTWEEASGNKQCKYCNRDFVDIIQKAHETGNFKPLLKKQ